MTKATLKGLNIGGWLILEKWMTPAVFNGTDAIDEYTLTQTKEGRAAIKAHHKSFIQESDFKWLKEHEIEVIRIPVGYWLFESDENLVPHVKYLDWAMDMAKKYDIQVLIDLHGLKGSQNGRDHSGKSGKSEWFNVKAYRDESIEVLEKIARRYANHPSGRKYDENGNVHEQAKDWKDSEKAQSAAIFFEYLGKAKENELYQKLKALHTTK